MRGAGGWRCCSFDSRRGAVSWRSKSSSGRWDCGVMARDVCLLLLIGGLWTHRGDVRQPRMGCDNVTLALGGAMKVNWGGDSHGYVGGELLCMWFCVCRFKPQSTPRLNDRLSCVIHVWSLVICVFMLLRMVDGVGPCVDSCVNRLFYISRVIFQTWIYHASLWTENELQNAFHA
jgi:hypothetical protein